MEKEILIPIYNATVKFVFSDDIDDSMSNHCDDIVENEESLVVWWADKHYYIVGIRKDKFSQQTITHECVHLSHRIMHNVGIPESLLNDEAEAYLTGYLAAQIADIAHEEIENDFKSLPYMKNFPI
jgi:hypothetical protein